MVNSKKNHVIPHSSNLLLNLSARLTIGSAVCFTEGLGATIVALLPGDVTFYILTTVLTFVIWLGFLLYRDTKLGADIGDLCLIEFVFRFVQLSLFYNDIEFEGFWFLYATLSFLKLIRVYVWHETATQQFGWGQFGLMTWLYARRNPQQNRITPWRTLLTEIGVAIATAIVACILIKLLPGWARVVVMWVVPVSFEFLIGPRQLRMINHFVPAFQASTAREAEKDAEIVRLKQNIERLQSTQNLPEDQNALVQAYAVLPPEKQQGLMEWAQLLSKNFGKKPPEVQ